MRTKRTVVYVGGEDSLQLSIALQGPTEEYLIFIGIDGARTVLVVVRSIRMRSTMERLMMTHIWNE